MPQPCAFLVSSSPIQQVKGLRWKLTNFYRV
jgi:hypothetical protein